MTKETERVLSGMYKNEVLDTYMEDLLFCFITTRDLNYWKEYRDAMNLRKGVITGECINVKNENERYKEEENTLGL